jgi:hypothetical protein
MKKKPTKIKVWPELVDFLPSLPAFREDTPTPDGIQAPVEVDFGSVRAVSSSGLTVFLLRLLRFLRGRSAPLLQHDCSPEILGELIRLQTFTHLSAIAGTLQNDLYLNEAKENVGPDLSDRILSFPVYRISFAVHPDRRQSLHEFRAWLSKQFLPLVRTHSIQANGLIMILGEIAKNTADHTTSDALFGMDIVALDQTTARFTFVFGDLGEGIKKHIEQHLPPEYCERRAHMSLYEAYRLALTPGYTSNRETGLNAGQGMSIIIDCANDLGLHLSVFDASSRGLLNNFHNIEKPSHAAVRRIFHSVGHDVGFFYFGEAYLKRTKQ